jgi:hypothetical protein
MYNLDFVSDEDRLRLERDDAIEVVCNGFLREEVLVDLRCSPRFDEMLR